MASRAKNAYVPEMVYVIGTAGSTIVKIGRTNDLDRRLRQLQPGNPAKLEVLWTVEGGSLIEGELHRWFKDCRVIGEWFDFGDFDPLVTISAATEVIKAWWASR